MIKQSLKMSIQNIISNKLRSFLTMLGIIIGVAAVIALITIVQGATNAIMDEFSGLGAGILSVNISGTAMKNGLTEKDVDLLREVDGVDTISPSASLSSAAVVDSEVFDKITVDGKDNLYFVKNDALEFGRPLLESDMDSNVCIVDNKFIESALLGKDIIGRDILLGGYTYTIIGVSKNDESFMGMMMDTSELDGTIIIPYKKAIRMSGKPNINSLQVYVAEGMNTGDVEDRLRVSLNDLFNNTDNSFAIINMESIMDSMDTVMGMMSTLLAGIASIALVVGGIGIMNMMLVSVTERTKEIGLRKALGAEPRIIQAQFLIESIILSMIGGFFGVILGIAIAAIVSKLLDNQLSVSLGSIVLGVGFSAGFGIVFGWAPARKASKLNPIDALRSD